MNKSFGIFYSSCLKVGGGPSGYLLNLRKSLNKDEKIDFILPSERKFSLSIHLLRILANCIPFRNLRAKLKEFLKLRHIANCINAGPSYRYIMCHSCQDLNILIKLWENGIIKRPMPQWILMSHSPTFPSDERKERASYRGNVLNYKLEKAEDLKAFKIADIIVAPSPNAMNAYFSDETLFLNDKKTYYIRSGCPALTRYNKQRVRNKYNIDTPFVICYIGRHWKVKGYDRLINIAKQILSKRDDVTFLIAGKINESIPPLAHSRWKEVGWSESAEIFSCSDIFIQLSRESYFDLVVPEALSLGVKCILSNVGGNRDFKRLCQDIDIVSNGDEAIRCINEYLRLPFYDRFIIERRLMNCYNNYFSEEKFAQGYIEFVGKLTDIGCIIR